MAALSLYSSKTGNKGQRRLKTILGDVGSLFNVSENPLYCVIEAAIKLDVASMSQLNLYNGTILLDCCIV